MNAPPKPADPRFSSGPCKKRPGWSVDALADAHLGRSYWAGDGRRKLADVISRTRDLLHIPDSHQIAITPGSDTGAMEMALWSLLGARGVDLLSWDVFGRRWVHDAIKELKIPDTRVLEADFGDIIDLNSVDFRRDVVFVWNATSSGVRVPDGDWIPDSRAGVTICDATSATLAQALPWDKLDATTFSWQKTFGGEGAHGMIVLSPRALKVLATHTPPWPIPRLFRLTDNGAILTGLFEGGTINTPSMLCVEDCLDALIWAQDNGGLAEMQRRADENFSIIEQWVSRTDWIEFLARDPRLRSNTSVCLTLTAPAITALPEAGQRDFIRRFADFLEKENAALDIAAHPQAPPGLRIWTGSTINADDLRALTPWLDRAFDALHP